MCVVRVNGDEAPCADVDGLELHELWGENGDPDNVNLEVILAGGYQKWVEKWKLDDSRSGCLLFEGPRVEDYE